MAKEIISFNKLRNEFGKIDLGCFGVLELHAIESSTGRCREAALTKAELSNIRKKIGELSAFTKELGELIYKHNLHSGKYAEDIKIRFNQNTIGTFDGAYLLEYNLETYEGLGSKFDVITPIKFKTKRESSPLWTSFKFQKCSL